MDPDSLALAPHFKSWLNKIPIKMLERKTIASVLQKYYDLYIDDLVYFLKTKLQEPVPSVKNNLIDSCCRIMDCFFVDYDEIGIKKVTPEEIEEAEKNIPNYFSFAVIWSVCATCGAESRDAMDLHVKELMQKGGIEFPNEGKIYDYAFIQKEKVWKPWRDLLEKFELDTKRNYIDVMVPTVDSIKSTFIIKMLTLNNKHVLTVGPTGTGKSVNINELL